MKQEKRISLTHDNLRFIWSLAFMSGRVEQKTHPNRGYAHKDETPLFEADMKRALGSDDLKFTKKLKAFIECIPQQ